MTFKPLLPFIDQLHWNTIVRGLAQSWTINFKGISSPIKLSVITIETQINIQNQKSYHTIHDNLNRETNGAAWISRDELGDVV